MKIYVVLYQNLWLEVCKVSQEGYRTLTEAQAFCLGRVDIKQRNDYEFYNIATQENYTIVEVSI